MQVFNAASKKIALRAFAAKEYLVPGEFCVIEPGQTAFVYGPVLTKYGHTAPYEMQGTVIVRDWARPAFQWDSDIPHDEVAIWPDKSSCYKRPCSLASEEVEGFFVSFYENRHSIPC